jgi:hypothetical protein
MHLCVFLFKLPELRGQLDLAPCVRELDDPAIEALARD